METQTELWTIVGLLIGASLGLIIILFSISRNGNFLSELGDWHKRRAKESSSRSEKDESTTLE